jgi:hypothetical protein
MSGNSFHGISEIRSTAFSTAVLALVGVINHEIEICPRMLILRAGEGCVKVNEHSSNVRLCNETIPGKGSKITAGEMCNLHSDGFRDAENSNPDWRKVPLPIQTRQIFTKARKVYAILNRRVYFRWIARGAIACVAGQIMRNM